MGGGALLDPFACPLHTFLMRCSTCGTAVLYKGRGRRPLYCAPRCRPRRQPPSPRATRGTLSKETVRSTLEGHGWVVAAAAGSLGCSRQYLHRLIARYGLERGVRLRGMDALEGATMWVQLVAQGEGVVEVCTARGERWSFDAKTGAPCGEEAQGQWMLEERRASSKGSVTP